jgi:hypothetical protein
MTLIERMKAHILIDVSNLNTAITNDDYTAAQAAIADVYNDVTNVLMLNQLELLYVEQP